MRVGLSKLHKLIDSPSFRLRPSSRVHDARAFLVRERSEVCGFSGLKTIQCYLLRAVEAGLGVRPDDKTDSLLRLPASGYQSALLLSPRTAYLLGRLHVHERGWHVSGAFAPFAPFRG